MRIGPIHVIHVAALSVRADFSVVCYSLNESRCHRSLLRGLLIQRGAKVV